MTGVQTCALPISCNLHKDAKIIASGALSGCYDLTEITIPDGIENIPVSSLKISSLEKITVGENNAVYTSLDGILYNKDMTEIILVPAAIKGEITVPETVTDLGAHFAERKYITSVIIPDSVSVIDTEAFQNCTALEKVRINDLEKWCNIAFGIDVFEPYSLYLKGKILTDLVVPDGMTQMKSYAFEIGRAHV